MTMMGFERYSEMGRIGHRTMRNNLAAVLGGVKANRAPVAVVNRGEAEAVLVDHRTFTEMADSQRQLDELQDTVGLLVAAAAAGAAVPSSTLERYGVHIPYDHSTLQSFQAGYPAHVRRDETGNLLAEVGPLTTDSYAPDVLEDDEFVDIDE